jgi:hypothetical protein
MARSHVAVILFICKINGFLPFYCQYNEGSNTKKVILNRKSIGFAYFCLVLAFNCINAMYYIVVFVTTILWEDIAQAIPVIGKKIQTKLPASTIDLYVFRLQT